MGSFTSSPTVASDQIELHERTSYAQLAIERLISSRKQSLLKSFLSTEKGFRREQFVPELSVVHYVAGREYETAEEADEWFGYLAQKGSQSIDKLSDGNSELRPLHCACEWGNVVGVNWLVNHGASITAEDARGRTPYYYACASSVERVKKMMVLEKRGYLLRSADITLVAQIQFASLKEAEDVFHHIFDVMGISDQDILYNLQAPPLHGACHLGTFFGVKCLVKHNAPVNGVNYDGQTPLMKACQSSVDRPSKVRYLDEEGADCRAKDFNGQTALFYATFHSECDDEEVRNVLQYLVNVKGIDVNSVDKEGRTPLLQACNSFLPSFVVIETLIGLGADFSARDKKKQNALHLAAEKSSNKLIFEFLIAKGVDVTCKDENGNTPHQLSLNGEIRMLLRQHYDAARFSVLQQREMARPDSIKVCVIGNEKVGKTTFVTALLQLDRRPIRLEDRTPGIEIHNCPIPDVGKATTWDFGAQLTFQKAHGFFFRQSNTIFFLVLPIEKGKIRSEEKLLEEGQFWCAFVKASLRTLPAHLKSLIRLFLIINIIGFEEEAGIEKKFQLDRVADILRQKFGDTFQISYVIAMDCSKSNSVHMKKCRETLKGIRQEMLKAADDVPKLCHDIEEYLSASDDKRKMPLEYFMTFKEFEKWVAKQVGVHLTDEEKKVAVEYLDSCGIIVNLGRRICVRPLWLCHNVIGPLLASRYYPFDKHVNKSGLAQLEDAEFALKQFRKHIEEQGCPSPYMVTAKKAIYVMLSLELCIDATAKEESTKLYKIPALLDEAMPVDAWDENPNLDMYRGQRYECHYLVDIISPSSLVILQSRCCRMDDVRHKLWRDGVKLVKIVNDKMVECLVVMTLKNERHCIDVTVRWSSIAACEAVAKEFLNDLKSMIAQACDETSPGVVLDWFYLDSSYLKQFNEDPPIYSSNEVDQKVADEALNDILFCTRPEGEENSCSIKNLVIIVPGASSNSVSLPADEELVSDGLMKACAAVTGSKWQAISIDLDISSDDRDEITACRCDNFTRMFRVLQLWKNDASSPTVGKLLRSLSLFGISQRAIKEKFEKFCSH